MQPNPQQPRFRIILPIIFIIVSGSLFAVCFLHIGHSPFCQYFLYSLFPARLFGARLSSALPSGMVQQGSVVWQILEGLIVPLAFLLTCLQYYLIGLAIDKLVSRRRH